MDANQQIDNFELNIVLEKISQTSQEMVGKKKTTIDLICNIDDINSVTKYQQVMNLLKQEKIIKGVRITTSKTYVEDESCAYENGSFSQFEMLLSTYSFILNRKELTNFLISTSRIPKYSVRMDKRRRIIINDKHVLSTPHFNSENYYFIEHCLKKTKGFITKEKLKTEGKLDVAKRFPSVLENLKFSPNLNGLFFSNVKNNTVEFRNQITVKDLAESNINEKKINAFIKSLPKYKLHIVINRHFYT